MLDQRGRLLVAALGFAGCSMPSYDRALHALRTWLDSWSGIGRVAVGMARQGYDLQGFIVTTLSGTNRAVVRFYNQHGTAEQWIKEGNGSHPLDPARLSPVPGQRESASCSGVIAHNLGNLWPWTRGGVKRRDPHGSLLSMIQVSSRLCQFLSPGQS